MITYTLSNPNELSRYWSGRWRLISGTPKEIEQVLRQLEAQGKEAFVCLYKRNDTTHLLYIPYEKRDA